MIDDGNRKPKGFIRWRRLFALAAALSFQAYLCSAFTVSSALVRKRSFHCLRRQSPLSFSDQSTGRKSCATKTKHRANEVLDYLKSRYPPSGAESDEKAAWKKAQMYLYRSHQRISWEQMEDVVEFLDSRVSMSTSKKILQTAPRILRKPVDSFLEPTSDFLLNLWGSDLFQQALDRNPQLLLLSGVGYTQRTREADSEIVRILTDVGGLSLKATQQLKKTSPFVFALPSQKVLSVCEYVLHLLESGEVPQASGNSPNRQRKILSRILVNHPALLNLSVEKNLEPRVQFIQSTCKMNTTDVAKMVQSSSGNVLALSVDDNLKPTLELLGEILPGDSSESMRKMLLSHPQILSLSMSNIQAKVDFFNGIDGRYSSSLAHYLAPESSELLASRILARCPAVYSLSLKDNILPKVDFLARIWGIDSLGFDDDPTQLSLLLKEFPNLLTMSLEGNIQPTLNFYNRTGYTSLSEDWQLLPGATRIPGRYIAASLYNRLLPRWHFCLTTKHTTIDESGERPYKNAPSLHLLVLSNDARFCDSLGLDPSEYSSFKDSAIPRLKFSSQFDTWLKTGRPIQV
eukprot:CAMPEP_0176005088 /NCGR_PEP_ID=MMETSP0120_2-20121206/2026_1 /TAXON_ID=160619 /ORGANISM="Kryptoperidinium foliaceum, Strain CCMP 1326" /LENGTH=572 /DNA_ID=CAMNT_0017337785 /DNA_START=145 /DNA_END=1863 /DNA_ORIENTATION=+